MSYELSHVLQDLILLVDSRMYTGCYLIISVSSGNSSDRLLKGPRSKPEKSKINEGVIQEEVFV